MGKSPPPLVDDVDAMVVVDEEDDGPLTAFPRAIHLQIWSLPGEVAETEEDFVVEFVGEDRVGSVIDVEIVGFAVALFFDAFGFVVAFAGGGFPGGCPVSAGGSVSVPLGAVAGLVPTIAFAASVASVASVALIALPAFAALPAFVALPAFIALFAFVSAAPSRSRAAVTRGAEFWPGRFR